MLGMVGFGNKTTGTLEFGVDGGTRNPIWAKVLSIIYKQYITPKPMAWTNSLIRP